MAFNHKTDLNPHQLYRIKKLKRELERAETYSEWKEIALNLDQETGAQEWKYDNSSPYFDAEIISRRLNMLRRYKMQNRVVDLIYILREGLSHDVANIGHPMLFTQTYVGTKKIIEDYIEEVSQCLIFIASQKCDTLSLKEKIEFFNNCQLAYGQPAMMFSGGATLGLFHTGVCKALREQDLMPKVLSGSSAGAMMTAMLGVSNSVEIDQLLTGDSFYSEAFHFRSWKELLRGDGGFADVRYLKKFLIENLGDLTFEEAYEKSGLDINISVAPYDVAQEDARIMNKYTAPDLLVWSAVLASCAVPILFPPVRLTSKRYDGVHTPYLTSIRWVDGSVRSDFPQEKLARLYNVNYTIASQVNPHIVPFMQTDEERFRTDLLSWPKRIVRTHGKAIAMDVMNFTRDRMGRVPTIRRMLDHGYGIIDQRYYGDLNIIGNYSLKHYQYMLQNPRPHLFKVLQQEGERATWSKISIIEAHARIGKTIEHCLELLQSLEMKTESVESTSKKTLFPQLKQALNPERSQSFGRQLYQVSIDDLDYWLKLQSPLVSDLHESSFLNEINRYQIIDHLKIAITAPHQILDFSQDEQRSFNILGQGLLVLTCEALFKRNPNDMSLKDIVAVLMESLSVVERLHAMAWIHGDLKSEHFRMYQGRAVLIDLEQVIDLNQASIHPNTATPRYMAPELFHSAPKSLASDIYALGIIWLEWLNQDKLEAKSYIEWAKLHCQALKIELDDPFSVFSPVLTLLLNKNKSVRCTNFYQIKHILSRIV